MLLRAIKNKVKNYTTPEILVREATSNDPWGPPTSIMAEISNLTYNVLAFNQIMQKLWKRMNDKHKNWRHVYKSLVLLDYLIKTGSPAVAEQARQNIESIRTLHDFQYFEGHKDLGINVREKSRVVLDLLHDEELLKSERKQAIAAKEKFSRISGAGMIGERNRQALDARAGGRQFPSSSLRMSDSTPDLSRFSKYSRGRIADEAFSRNSMYPRPGVQEGSDEMDEELQIALEVSRMEHEDALQKRKEEEAREEYKLKLAMEESLKSEIEVYDILQDGEKPRFSFTKQNTDLEIGVVDKPSHPISKPQKDLDLLAIDPWATTPDTSQNFSFNTLVDPFSTPTKPISIFSVSVDDPWGENTNGHLDTTPNQSYDPWASGGKTYLGFADKLPYNKSAPSFSGDKQFHVSSAVPAKEEDLFNAFNPPSYEKTVLSGELTDDFFSPLNSKNVVLEEAYSFASDHPLNFTAEGVPKLTSLEINFDEDFKCGVLESGATSSQPKKDTVKDFLSQNSTIVDLNNIATLPKGPPALQYRFQMAPDGHSTFAKTSTFLNNPFASPPSKATLNEIAQKRTMGVEGSSYLNIGDEFSFGVNSSQHFSSLPPILPTNINTRHSMQPSLNPFL